MFRSTSKDTLPFSVTFRRNNKLLCSLCKSCAFERNLENEFAHETVAEKALTGTWVNDEVRMAVQKGDEDIES